MTDLTPNDPEKISGLTYIGELPSGEWKLSVHNGNVIAVCPDHEPRLIRAGKIEIIKPITEYLKHD